MTINKGASSPWPAGEAEARVMVQDTLQPEQQVFVDCFFPTGGGTVVETYCTGTRSS
jgi:hypothetical protein